MKKETENPFKYGTVVAGEYFTDRTKEVIEIEHALMSPNHLVLISPRRFGKSSLVKKAVEQVERLRGWKIWRRHCLKEYFAFSLVKS